MGKYSEVFVAFDVAKKKHAVAIAEGVRAIATAMVVFQVSDTACPHVIGPTGRLFPPFEPRACA
jgi:hypothetical protein